MGAYGRPAEEMNKRLRVEARELTQPLCQFTDLPEGRSRGFDPLGEGRDTMFVIRQGGCVHAYRNACPHYDRARMAWKKDEFLNGDQSRIMCAAHGALFRIENGDCVEGPCLGQSLTPVEIEIRDGAVWVLGLYEPGFRR